MSMTDLKEGHRYSLSTESDNNKSVIFVKLTDSALQSIESFFNSKGELSRKPTIQFQTNNGVISLPLNGRPHDYRFTLSNIEVDKQQSSFQCLQVKSDSTLESLGFMFMKMQIHATEDSYEKTKSKMTAADQEQKNLCTKELQQSVTRLGNKMNTKRPGLKYISERIHTNVKKPEPAKLNLKNKIASPSALIQQPIRQRIIHILAAKPYKKAELLLRLKREGIRDKEKDQINDILTEVAQLKGSVLTLENHVWNEVQEDWEFSSIAELQLIKKKKQQFLKVNSVNGVNSHSKPSVNQKDKSSVPEKKLCNKKLFPNLNDQDSKFIEKPNLVSNGSHQASKRQSAIAGYPSSLQSSFVRQEHRTETDGKSGEEMCLEIANRGSDIDQLKSRTSSLNSDVVSACKQIKNNNISKIQVKQSNNCSETNINGNGYSRNLSVLQKPILSKQQLKDDSPRCHKKIKNGYNNNDSKSEIIPTAQVVSEFSSEIKLKYPKVESLEQRSQYFKEFNDDYEEYLKLQSEMKKISDRFLSLSEQLKAHTEGSPEYKKMEMTIYKDYQTAIKNGYFAFRKRFEFLKVKLSHIKILVHDFDENFHH